jgi:hypothetical protein
MCATASGTPQLVQVVHKDVHHSKWDTTVSGTPQLVKVVHKDVLHSAPELNKV